MATKLSHKITSTSKFQGQKINCLCLKNEWSNLTMWISRLIWFIYDLDHWDCVRPRPWISTVRPWNCNIFEISDLIVNSLHGLISSWLIISYLGFAFITFCGAVQVERFYCWQHKYAHITITTDGNGVIKGISTCMGDVYGFTPYAHRFGMILEKF